MADNQISIRHPNKADLAKMATLLTKVFTFDGLVIVQSHEELEEELSGPYCHLENDVIIVEKNSEIVGIGYTIFLPSETKEERCYIFGGVDPDFRRQGIGTSIMNWAVPHGTSQLQSTGRKIPKYLRTDVIKSNESAKQLFTKFEMHPVRWNEDLIIDLSDAPTEIENSRCSIVSWDPARDEEARIVKNLAFADHWGSTPTTKEGWEQMVHGSTARLDHSFFALDSQNKIIGLLLSHRYESDDTALGKRIGWIDKLATLSEHRRKSIAKSLIIQALNAYRNDGLSHGALDVDTENPTGAYGLYKSIGFSQFRGKVTYELQIF
jgi:mycothiol synthase